MLALKGFNSGGVENASGWSTPGISKSGLPTGGRVYRGQATSGSPDIKLFAAFSVHDVLFFIDKVTLKFMSGKQNIT